MIDNKNEFIITLCSTIFFIISIYFSVKQDLVFTVFFLWASIVTTKED